MDDVNDSDYYFRLTLVLLFGLCMAYFEAAVVVYIRELFYPEGFSLPLKVIDRRVLTVEVGREVTSLFMILTVAGLAGRRFWERFGFSLVIFGVWDIFYYVWLKVAIGWPSSLTEWDVLFLIPRPWLAPVIAPILVALLMILFGAAVTRLYAHGRSFRPTLLSFVLALIGTAAILNSFMRDTDAAYNLAMPQPYMYWLLVVGLVCYVAGFAHAWQRAVKSCERSAFRPANRTE